MALLCRSADEYAEPAEADRRNEELHRLIIEAARRHSEDNGDETPADMQEAVADFQERTQVLVANALMRLLHFALSLALLDDDALLFYLQLSAIGHNIYCRLACLA